MSNALKETIKFIYDKCKHHRSLGENLVALEYFNIYLKLTSSSLHSLDSLDTLDTLDTLDKLPKVSKNEEENEILVLLLEEFNIFSYYTEVSSYGSIISDRLLFSRYNNFRRDLVIANQRFYLKKLDRVSRHTIFAKCAKGYTNLNASIIPVKDGYLINARTVNYILTEDGNYHIVSGEKNINTMNYILMMDKEYKITTQYYLVDKSICDTYNSRVIGLEDIILFEVGKELWFTCTTLDTNPANLPQISLCKISDTTNSDNELEVVLKRPIYLIEEHRPEKNWLPFYSDGTFNFIYSYNPFIVRSISYEDAINGLGFIESKLSKKVDLESFNLGRFRGSAGPLDFDDGYLYVVHEVIFMSDKKRIYTHRFVYTDKSMTIRKLSLGFFFEELSVEFCRSMCHSHDANHILLTVGIKDRESWLYVLDSKEISKMMLDVKYFKL